MPRPPDAEPPFPPSARLQVYRGTCGCEPAAVKVGRWQAFTPPREHAALMRSGQTCTPHRAHAALLGCCAGVGGARRCHVLDLQPFQQVPVRHDCTSLSLPHSGGFLQVIKDPAGAGVSEMDRQQLLREVAILKSCRWGWAARDSLADEGALLRGVHATSI